MAAYVAYFDGAPPGQGADARIVASVHRSQALANAAGGAAGVSAHAGAVADEVDVGSLIDSGTGAVLAWADPAAAAAQAAAWRLRLHRAWRAYVDGSGRPATARQDWWPEIAGDRAALTATDRWAYSQIALGDVIAGGGVAALGTTALREAAIAHIETAISTLGRVWYGVMRGDAAKRGDWSAGSVAANARIYSDLFTAGYAVRAADGAWTQLAARVPAGFQPDSETLR